MTKFYAVSNVAPICNFLRPCNAAKQKTLTGADMLTQIHHLYERPQCYGICHKALKLEESEKISMQNVDGSISVSFLDDTRYIDLAGTLRYHLNVDTVLA